MQVGSEPTTLNLARWRSLTDFTILRCIGRGNNARAFLAKTRTSQLRVLRIIDKNVAISNDEVPRAFAQKQILLFPRILEHPFIISLHSTFQTERHLIFTMEYAPAGDLMHHVQKGAFGFSRARFYAAELYLAIAFLHAQSMIHRGISLDNILLTKDGHVKLIGFSCSKRITGRTCSFVGNAELMAPEMLKDEEYGFAVDWWAFGVVLYQMLLQRSPFRGEDEEEIHEAILRDEPIYPTELHSEARSLIQGLLKRIPEDRLGSAGETGLREHPFFTDISWEAVEKQEMEPPFKPNIAGESDTSNFDAEFTQVDVPDLSAEDSGLSEDQQRLFDGF